METLILTEMEPGSFFWWFVRDFWSVVWTICAIAPFLFIILKIYNEWGCWHSTDTEELYVGGGAGIIACIAWPLLSISFLGCSGCGPWLDDEERDGLRRADSSWHSQDYAGYSTNKWGALAKQITKQSDQNRMCAACGLNTLSIFTYERAAGEKYVCVNCGAETTAKAKAKAAAKAEAKAKAEEDRVLTDKKKKVSLRLAQFADTEGALIAETIEHLRLAEQDLEQKIIELHEVIEALGRLPWNDEEYQAWQTLKHKLQRDRQQLQRQLENTFLASERFRLAPPGGNYKAELEASMKAANGLVEELKERYRGLNQDR